MRRGPGCRVWCGRETGIPGTPRPPPRAAGCVVSRGSSGFVSVRGARARLPGCVSRTNGSGPGAPEPGEAAAAAFSRLELDPSLCSADARARRCVPPPRSPPRWGVEPLPQSWVRLRPGGCPRAPLGRGAAGRNPRVPNVLGANTPHTLVNPFLL